MNIYQKQSSFFLFLFAIIFSVSGSFAQQKSKSNLRLGVSGISHGHSGWIFEWKGREKPLNVVGVYEPDTALSGKFIRRYKLNPELFYTNLTEMLEKTRPEAVAAFGSIYAHLATVEACAPRGIHVMVEKPLAVSVEQVAKMESLAKKHKIFLLTNYETSWYPSTENTYRLVYDSNFLGKIRKMTVNDGHNGPKEIGVGKEFFDWLTDPVLNGGGAVVDFGCYGANLMTWLMKGETPLTVSAVTSTFKPGSYPKVDDDAVILVHYTTANGVIQGSWNWPFGRKDMEIYGETGQIFADNSTDMRIRKSGMQQSANVKVTAKEMDVYTDPFAYFTDVVRGEIKVPPFGLYSLENNVIVVKILDAARESARTGKTIKLK